jgi:hypothetical protein
MAAADRQKEELDLYQRLLAEAAQKEEENENPQREKHQRMRAYVKGRRRTIPGGGGYVISEEMREEQERYLADLQSLRSLMVNGARGLGEGYRLAYLRRKYPTEYAHLRDIEISSK